VIVNGETVVENGAAGDDAQTMRPERAPV
jgi:hypothetical protein